MSWSGGAWDSPSGFSSADAEGLSDNEVDTRAHRLCDRIDLLAGVNDAPHLVSNCPTLEILP